MALLYALAVGAMSAVPLLRVLHAESSALVAGVGWMVAGVFALAAFRRGEAFGAVLRTSLAALAVPWALLTLSLLWTPNAGYAQGLLLFLTFAPPSVALAVALAYALTGTDLKRPGWMFFAVTLALLVATPLYDLGLHPQFYHYDHVWGGLLGPIYDEELALRPGLFAFRGLTLLWALVAFLYGEARRGRPQRVRMRAALALVALTYAAGGWLGIVTPAWALRQALDGHAQTPHFDLYFDAASTDSADVARLARLHEYRYAQLRETLGVGVRGRVQSYVYPTPRVRARLTGAAQTSVAPVWLRTPQMHLVAANAEDVLAHELAHVFSRQFGLPVVRASRYVGLVEGLAVAVEPPDGLPSPHEQTIAAALASGDADLAGRVARSLGPGGFWTARGAVSYTTMGSFTRFLLDAHGAEKLRAVYAWGDFSAVYGAPIDTLVAEWEAYLMGLDLIARAAAPLAEQRFSVPSLFETSSPHYVPRHVRLTRRAADAATRDEALDLLERALARAPAYAPALDGWARILLQRGEPSRVWQRLDTLATDVPALLLRRADAAALLGDTAAARTGYALARAALPLYAHAARVTLGLWSSLAPDPEAVGVLYAEVLPPSSAPPALTLLLAVRMLDAQPGSAYAVLAKASLPGDFWATPGERALFEAQQAAWRAEAALSAGRYAAAVEQGREASSSFAALGDANAAARWLDVARQARWAQAPPLPVAPKPSAGGGRASRLYP